MATPNFKNVKHSGMLSWVDTTKKWVAYIDKQDDIIDAIGGFTIGEYDYISVAYPNTTTEVYTFKTGGSGGTTVATITVVYSDSTKEALTSVTKT